MVSCHHAVAPGPGSGLKDLSLAACMQVPLLVTPLNVTPCMQPIIPLSSLVQFCRHPDVLLKTVNGDNLVLPSPCYSEVLLQGLPKTMPGF
jgi:hypothetical protein